MGQDTHEIVVHYRPVPHLPFEQSAPPANVLRLKLNPDRMELGVNINDPGDPFALEPTTLAVELVPQELSAYARLRASDNRAQMLEAHARWDVS